MRRKNALTVLFLTMLAMAIISFQWFFWVRSPLALLVLVDGAARLTLPLSLALLQGYSLAFSPTGGPFLGDMHHFVLRHVLETPVPQANNKVPQVVYMM